MILTSKIAIKTARLLSYAIREVSSNRARLMYTARAHKVKRLHIRYGNTDPTPCEDTKFNSKSDIEFLRDKNKFSILLRKNGYIAPEFIQDRYPKGSEFPVLIRKTLISFRGYGIVICRNMGDFEQHWRSYTEYFWCRYLDNSSEYRLHVVKPTTGDPQILRVMKKIPRDSEVEKQPIKVRHLNRYFYSRRFEPYGKYPRMLGKAIEVAKLLPGRFFTLDVAWSRKRSDVIFFETNTASGLDNAGAKQYAEFFVREGVV